jgi:hypothetical protein
MPTPPEQEQGQVEAVEFKRLAKRGAMHPILCRADDGAHYFLKTFSTGRTWPLVLEWICARLGRAVALPIPNYRKVTVSDELAEEWNDFHERKIEPGVGFGSQMVSNSMEFEASMNAAIPEELQLRVLAFDWWIRNYDRGEKNPNLLWNTELRKLYVIDHDQAAQQSDASIFWGTHLFKSISDNEIEWLPPGLASEFEQALSRLYPQQILSELPSEWTSSPDGLDWFVRQLDRSINDNTPTRDWRNHE